MSVAFFRTAFPRLHITIEELAGDADSIKLGWVAESCPDDEQFLKQHGNQHDKLIGTIVGRFADGQIVESWITWDHDYVLQGFDLARPT